MSTIISTNFQLGTSIISNGAVTGNKWSNPNYLLLTDGDNAESTPGQVASDVVVGNFNAANVPSNAVITGFEIELIGAYAGSITSPVTTLTPYFLDNTSGEDVYYPYVTPQVLSITPTDYVLGSPTYLFATSFTPDQINNAKIQLVANGDIFVDAIKINVYYYVPETPTPPTPSGSSCPTCNSPLQAQPFYLKLPFLSDDRFAILQSFNYPDGTPILYADLGACGGYVDLVFDPGMPKVEGSNFEENTMTAIWTVLEDGSVQLDFGTDLTLTRGLQFHTPYAGEIDLRSDHDANSMVLLSNNAHYESRFLRECQIGSVVSAPIDVQQNGSDVVNPATVFNFLGAGVSVSDGGDGVADITINGNTVNTPPVVSVANASSGNSQVGSLTYPIVISGVNRAIVIQVSTQQSVIISSITVDGVSASRLVASSNAGSDIRQEQWGLVAPHVGTVNIVITLSAPGYINSGAECFNGVNQSSTFGNTQNASGNSNTPLLVLTTANDNSNVVDGLATAQTPILYTPGAGQTTNWLETANSDTRQGGSSYEAAGSAPDAVTMQYSITQSTEWCYTAVEINGIPAVEPIVSPLTVQDESGSVIVPNTVKIKFPTGSVSNPSTGEADIDFSAILTNKVAVDASDTTPNYLDDKIEVISSDMSVTVTKTIDNPSGDEKISYDLSVLSSLGSVFYQRLPVQQSTSAIYATQQTTSEEDGSVVYLVTKNPTANNLALYRFQKDATGQYWLTAQTAFVCTGGGGTTASEFSIAVVGSFVYVIVKDDAANKLIFRFVSADFTSQTSMTISGTAFADGRASWSDGTDLYIYESTGVYRQYSISGTTVTNVTTITYTGSGVPVSVISDGTDVFIIGNATTIVFRKYAVTGGSAISSVTRLLQPAYLNVYNPLLVIMKAGVLGVIFPHTEGESSSGGVISGTVDELIPITMP